MWWCVSVILALGRWDRRTRRWDSLSTSYKVRGQPGTLSQEANDLFGRGKAVMERWAWWDGRHGVWLYGRWRGTGREGCAVGAVPTPELSHRRFYDREEAIILEKRNSIQAGNRFSGAFVWRYLFDVVFWNKISLCSPGRAGWCQTCDSPPASAPPAQGPQMCTAMLGLYLWDNL